MTPEQRNFTLLVFEADTIRAALNVEEGMELNLELHCNESDIIEAGRPVPQSALYGTRFGFVMTDEAYLVQRNPESKYVVQFTNLGSKYLMSHLTHELMETDIDNLLSNCTIVKINDLNNPEIMEELNKRDPEALAGIIEDLNEVK